MTLVTDNRRYLADRADSRGVGDATIARPRDHCEYFREFKTSLMA